MKTGGKVIDLGRGIKKHKPDEAFIIGGLICTRKELLEMFGDETSAEEFIGQEADHQLPQAVGDLF
jgi:hypothetical protein